MQKKVKINEKKTKQTKQGKTKRNKANKTTQNKTKQNKSKESRCKLSQLIFFACGRTHNARIYTNECLYLGCPEFTAWILRAWVVHTKMSRFCLFPPSFTDTIVFRSDNALSSLIMLLIRLGNNAF